MTGLKQSQSFSAKSYDIKQSALLRIRSHLLFSQLFAVRELKSEGLKDTKVTISSTASMAAMPNHLMSALCIDMLC